jgi:putative peptidoglycan binding protein
MTTDNDDTTTGGPVGEGDYVVADGESVDSISFALGFFPDTIWDDPANASIKQIRADRNILLPGDRLTIPVKTLKQVGAKTGQRHVFRRRGVPSVFRICLMRTGTVRAGESYTLTIGGKARSGTTSDAGLIEEWIPPDADEGTLVVGEDVYALDFGRLVPVTEIKGVQQRLNNLGHDCGKPDGKLNELTIAAIRAFQERVGLTATGAADNDTRQKLAALHDEVG